MPQRLTPSVHSKSLAGRSQIRPPANTPGVVAEHVHVAERRVRVVGERGDRRRSCDTSVTIVVIASGILGRGLVERSRLDVGRDDVRAVRRERMGEAPADAAAGAGDDRDLAGEIVYVDGHRRMLADRTRLLRGCTARRRSGGPGL